MDEIAKQIGDALEKDFPGTKLKHAPHPGGNGQPAPVTLSQQLELVIEGLRTRIAMLEKLKATL
jgi:hypothetical protein